MKNAPELSVVLAVYNAKAFIRNAIEGVLAQTFSDFELLIVDDGSSDGTGEICDEYAKHDACIRVFHEQHLGVAHARQIAIDNAIGKYILHIDADDHTSPTMLEEMWRAAEDADADLLICDYKECIDNEVTLISQCPTSLHPAAVADDLLERRLFGALWNKLFRASCVKESNIKFHQDLDLREDIVFVLDMLPHIEHITYLPQAFYTYDRRANANSLSNTYIAENRHYYEQEILWHKAALDCPLISVGNRQHVLECLLNDAYITLSGTFFSAEEWMEIFTPSKELFKEINTSYKQRMVNWALSGCYPSASWLRRMIAHIRGTV